MFGYFGFNIPDDDMFKDSSLQLSAKLAASIP